MTTIEYDREYGSPLAAEQPEVAPLGFRGVKELVVGDMADFGNGIGDGLEKFGKTIVGFFNRYHGLHEAKPQMEIKPIPVLDAVESGLRNLIDNHSTAPLVQYESTGHLIDRKTHEFGAAIVNLVHPHRHHDPEKAA